MDTIVAKKGDRIRVMSGGLFGVCTCIGPKRLIVCMDDTKCTKYLNAAQGGSQWEVVDHNVAVPVQPPAPPPLLTQLPREDVPVEQGALVAETPETPLVTAPPKLQTHIAQTGDRRELPTPRLVMKNNEPHLYKNREVPIISRSMCILATEPNIRSQHLVLRSETRPDGTSVTLRVDVPEIMWQRIWETQMPLVNIPSRGRAMQGNFFTDSLTVLGGLVFVFIDPAEGLTVQNRRLQHPYIHRLDGFPTHFTVMLPHGDGGIRYARQCIKLFMEAVLDSPRYRPNNGLYQDWFDCYFMIDDQVAEFRQYGTLPQQVGQHIPVSDRSALLNLWRVLVTDQAPLVSSAPSRVYNKSKEYYIKNLDCTHRRTSRAEQVLILSRKHTQDVSYACDTIMSLSKAQRRNFMLLKYRGELDEVTQRLLFQGEDWSINGQLISHKRYPLMMLRLWHKERTAISINGTLR